MHLVVPACSCQWHATSCLWIYHGNSPAKVRPWGEFRYPDSLPTIPNAYLQPRRMASRKRCFSFSSCKVPARLATNGRPSTTWKWLAWDSGGAIFSVAPQNGLNLYQMVLHGLPLKSTKWTHQVQKPQPIVFSSHSRFSPMYRYTA